MEPWSRDPAGRFDELELDSEALRGNTLGDPHVRPLWVYAPPAYDAEPERRFPAIYLIQGLTGQLDMWRNRSAFRPTVTELVDRLFAEEGCPPALVVFVDAWTSYGGSQFVDSPAVGRYHTYLCDEVVPFVDARYRTLAEPGHRGISGKSSGGYGAMITPMLRPDLFGGLATHAGDALFEHCYIPDFREAIRALRELRRVVRPVLEGLPLAAGVHEEDRLPAAQHVGDGRLLLGERGRLGRAAVRPSSGQLRPDVWERWLAWDPVRMAERHADALRGLRAIYIDAGTKDQYFLDVGATAFREALAAIGVTDVFYELFDATHSGIEYRYPLALRYLAERLQ